MKKQRRTVWRAVLLLLLFLISGCLTGCVQKAYAGTDEAMAEQEAKGQEMSAGQTGETTSQSKEQTEEGEDDCTGCRETVSDCPVPEASGDLLYESEDVTIDYSHTEDGYIMCRYLGDNEKVKIRIEIPDGTIYTNTLLQTKEYETFPLTGGDGHYQICVYENVQGTQYALEAALDIDVVLENEFLPFLYPNQYCWYTKGSKTVQFAAELSRGSHDDLSFVTNVYKYTTESITYDEEKAAVVKDGYVPVVDEILESGKGICFDYASLMCAMLRSQGIPTKLQIGYYGEIYHAWISVYLEEIGWVDNIIEFDGKNWSMMDPTLGASEQDQGNAGMDRDSYQVKYSY